MASTPSASALSAVLRCRGNIWARNPPTKRPVTSVYSRGAAGGVLRDPPAERTRSKVPAWDAFLQGERVVVGRRLTVAYKSPRVEGPAAASTMRHRMRKTSDTTPTRQTIKSTVPPTSSPQRTPPALDKVSQRTDLTDRESKASAPKIHTVIQPYHFDF